MSQTPLFDALTAEERISFVRGAVQYQAPYFSAILMALVPKVAHGLGTIGVTKNWILMYDPAAIEKWSLEELIGVMLHELQHVVRAHHERGEEGGYDHKKFNIAGDLEINDDIVEAGWVLPEEALLPQKWNLEPNLTAEQYYNLIPADAAEQLGLDGDADGDDQQGKGQGDPNAPSPKIARGWCGSCAGNPLPDEPEGEGAEKEGRSKLERQQARETTAREVQQAAKSRPGSVPSGLKRWAEEQLKPHRVPWEKQLARSLRRAINYRPGCVDYTYTKRARRQDAMAPFGGAVPLLPAMHRPIARVSVFIDTSGSMSEDDLGIALSELDGILKTANAEVEVGVIDCEIHSVKPVTRWQDAAKALIGGGGTSFIPVFEYVNKQQNHRKPEIVVMVTDGCGPAPKSPPPGVIVIWLLVGRYRSVPVDWGDVIEIEE